MTALDAAREVEAERLARARGLVQFILREWDWITWNTLLADDVALSLRLGAIGINQVGGFDAVDRNLRVTGREGCEALIAEHLQRPKKWTFDNHRNRQRIRCGPAGQLGGAVTESEALSLPIALYMALDYEGIIKNIVIAATDLRPLVEAIRAAAQNATGPAEVLAA